MELEAGQREHRLRLVTDSVGLPILYFDRQLKIRFANRPFGNWIGVPSDDLLGHALKDVLPNDAFGEMQGYVDRAFAGATVTYERRERQLEGDARWTRITLFPDRELGGRVGGAFAVMTDIEDDIRIRDQLKSQEAQMRLFADNIPGPIAYLDRNLTYTFVNQAFANSVCKPQDEIYGNSPFQVMSSEVASFLRPVLKRAQAGEHVEYERIGSTAAGTRRWLHGRVAPDLDATGSVRGLYCTEYDIHELKLTQQALAAREEQLRLFNDNIPEPIVYLSADRRYRFVNEAFLRLVGLDREQVIGRTTDEVAGADLAELMNPSAHRRRSDEAITHEQPIVDAGGRERVVRARLVPDVNFDGTIKGEYVIGHDITDLKQAQDALAAREGQLRAIMDGVPAPVAYIDRDEHCHYVNRTFLQFFGLTPEQVSVMRLRDVVGHGIYQSAQAMFQRALDGEVDGFRPAGAGANGVKRWMTIVVPDAAANGEVLARSC
ncbi:MAG: PAS domain-containing protein [Burkholderiales bacterium]